MPLQVWPGTICDLRTVDEEKVIHHTQRSQSGPTTSASVSAEESSDAESDFHRVESGIVIPKTSIRDVQIARFQTPVIFCREDVGTDGCRGGKVHSVRSCRHVVVRDEHSTVEFEVRRKAAVAVEVPLQPERAGSRSVGGIRGLEDEKDGGGVDGVLKASA